MSILTKILEASAEYEAHTRMKPLYLVLGTSSFAALYCEMEKCEEVKDLSFMKGAYQFFGMSVVVVSGMDSDAVQVCGDPFFDFERGVKDGQRHKQAI